MTYYRDDYKTAKVILQIYAFFGWFLVAIAIFSIFLLPDVIEKAIPRSGGLGLTIGIIVGFLLVPWVVIEAGGVSSITGGLAGITGKYGNLFDSEIA